MPIYTIKINDIAPSSFIDDKKPADEIKVVPSTLMRTPSSNFAKAFDFLTYDGIYSAEVNSSSGVVSITELEAYLRSYVGIHFIEITSPININISQYEDGDYDLHIYIKFNENNSEENEYILDFLNIELVESGNSSSDENSILLSTVSISSGDVSEIKNVFVPILKPSEKNVSTEQDYNTNVKYKDKSTDDKFKLYIDDGEIILEKVE
jgi:hypothetical protein